MVEPDDRVDESRGEKQLIHKVRELETSWEEKISKQRNDNQDKTPAEEEEEDTYTKSNSYI